MITKKIIGELFEVLRARCKDKQQIVLQCGHTYLHKPAQVVEVAVRDE